MCGKGECLSSDYGTRYATRPKSSKHKRQNAARRGVEATDALFYFSVTCLWRLRLRTQLSSATGLIVDGASQEVLDRRALVAREGDGEGEPGA
jgi:hypothetical protein